MLASVEPPAISLGDDLEPLSCMEAERSLEALTYYEAEVAPEPHVGDKAWMKCILDGDALVLVELERGAAARRSPCRRSLHGGTSPQCANGSRSPHA